MWRGRAVGGSSTINGQIAIRGVPDDFERWRGRLRGLGLVGLPYFNRLETDVNFGDAPYHGKSGRSRSIARPSPTGGRWIAR